MNQEKMGRFLKALRKEKDLTQAELAEIIAVSNRTVSRWETGANAPDLAILVELANFYQVDIGELIAGERRESTLETESRVPTNDVPQVVAYSQEEQAKRIRMLRIIFFIAIVCLVSVFILDIFVTQSTQFTENSRDFLLGLASGIMLFGFVMTTRIGRGPSREFFRIQTGY